MKLYRILYCILFFLVLAVPLVGMIWYEEPEVTENKELAKMPQVIEEDKWNIHYLEQLQDYFSDHFAYRQEMVTANAVIMHDIFAQSSEELAIVGDNDWLYLKVTLDDYQGTNRMSERGIHNLQTIIFLMQEYVEGQGKTFVFASAPNKNTLYPGNMPYYYKKTEQKSNLARLTECIDFGELRYVDLVALFSGQNEVLYHTGDSHWNNKGAAMVADTLLDKVGIEHTDFTKLEYGMRDDFEGDIDKILFPLNRHTEMEYDYSQYMDYTYVEESDVTANTVETAQTNGNGHRLLCFRDSFGNSLLPFLAQDFDNAKFCKAVPYRLDYMYTEDRDVCVVELVERNLVNLIKFSPVMPAPLRTLDATPQIYTSEDSTCVQSEFENYDKLSGKVDAAYVDDDSPIYIQISGEAGCYTLEATPSDESSISGKPSDYGYTAYIGKNAFPSGNYQVSLITKQGATYYSTTMEQALVVE